MEELFREKLPHLIKPPLRAGIVHPLVVAADRLELFEQLFLPRSELHRRFDHDMAMQVAVVVRTHALDAPAAQAEYLAALGFDRYADLRLSVERGDLQLTAEGGGGEADWHLAVEVVTVALEHGMRAQLNDDEEIASRSAVDPRFALAGKTDAVAIVDTLRDLD